MKRDNLKNGIAQLVVVVAMAFLALGLPLTTKLVQQSQENRSQAVFNTPLIMSDGGGSSSCKDGVKRCVSKYIRERCDNGKWIKEDCQKMNPVGHMVCVSGWCRNPSSSTTKTPTPTSKANTSKSPIIPSGVKYDFNLDGKFEEKDFKIVSEYIVSLPKILYDVNDDNQVDITDVAKLVDIYNETNNKKSTPTPTITPTKRPTATPTPLPTKKPTSTPTIKTKINLTPKILNLEVGKSIRVKAETIPKQKLVSYIWLSDNSDIAIVDVNGLVTGKKAGKTNIKITIKNSDISTSIEAVVKSPVPAKSPTPTKKPLVTKPTNTPAIKSIQTPTDPSDSFGPITPKSFKENYLTDTLKIWRSRPNSNYSIYHIWAKEPYKQLHTYSSSSYGKNYDSIGNIMKNALAKAIDQDKLTMLVNGSHHVMYSYTPKTLPVSSYKEYNHGGLIIEEGKVLRDDPLMLDGRGRARYLALDNKNVLNFYSDNSNMKSENRKTMYEQTKNSGALNTIKLIGGELLINNGVVTSDTRKNSWQGFCQINENNFVHVVVNPNSRNVMSRQNLGNILKSFGCTNAYLLDGGGSSNVWIKDQNTTKIKKLQGDGGSRGRMWNIFYWSEL